MAEADVAAAAAAAAVAAEDDVAVVVAAVAVAAGKAQEVAVLDARILRWTNGWDPELATGWRWLHS
jgi:hypothetical protein